MSTLNQLANQMIPVPQNVTGDSGGTWTVPEAFARDLAGYRLGDAPPAPLRFDESVAVKPTPTTGPIPVADQSYRLVIDDEGPLVAAESELGRLYAVQTLRQLLFVGDGRSLPYGTIDDVPSLALRGYMIDVSRDRVPTRETLLRYLDLLLLIKVNHFELYTEHTFAYVEHHAVWEDWSPITAEDVRWLDSEARRRGIELVPNQNSFGHLRRWLEQPAYTHLAETPDGFTSPWGQRFTHPFSLAPTVPETQDFLAGLYDELLPNFTSNLFNVGLDETFDLGQGRSAGACDTRGTGQVYVEFLRDVHKLVSTRGKRMLFYGDIIQNHPEVIQEVPTDSIAIEWWYEARNEFDAHCRRLRDAGLQFIVAPGTSSWNSLTGRYDNAVANVRAAVSAAVDHGALGILMTDWGDNGHVQPYPLQLPPLVFSAGLAWNPLENDDDRLPFAFLALAPGGLEDSRLAEALERLGRIHAKLGPDAHNNTLFGVSLLTFDVDEYHRQLTEHTFDDAWVRSELTAARELAHAAKATGGNATERALLTAEIELAADLAEFALDLIPIHRGVAADQGVSDFESLQRRAADLEAEHRRQWLRRFRRGGLDDSSTYLWKALRALEARARRESTKQ